MVMAVSLWAASMPYMFQQTKNILVISEKSVADLAFLFEGMQEM